jgi:long-chain fatty acid transport protein
MVMHFPEVFSWGVAFRPTAKLTLAIDVEWGRWSSFDRMTLDLRHEIPQARFSDIPIDFNWEDSWNIKFGAEYRVSDRFAIRGGYAFLENPVPAKTLNPGTPDSDSHNFTVGFGYKLRKWVIDVSYVAGLYHDRKVNNAILSGDYKSFAQYAGLSIGYKF